MKTKFPSPAGWIALLAGVACFGAGWQMHRTAGGEAREMPRVTRAKVRSFSPLVAKGAALLVEWQERVNACDGNDLESLAKGLSQNSHRLDEAMWIPLLARWSDEDAEGMMAFLKKDAPPALKAKLLEMAWFAWGCSDPDAAFAAGRELPENLGKQVIEGIAETDLRKAGELSLRMAGSQFVRGGIVGRLVKEAPDLAAELEARAIYDGGRMPFHWAKIDELAAGDPAAAIAYARSTATPGIDPVPRAVEAIAKLDPEKAAREVESMPSSRSKALSSVTLAGTWAASDPDAAVEWIHGNLDGAVRQSALLAAAEASGNQDPAKAMDLVLESDWVQTADFSSIRDYGTISPYESTQARNTTSTAVGILGSWFQKDPAGALNYLEANIPIEMREHIAMQAGMNP